MIGNLKIPADLSYQKVLELLMAGNHRNYIPKFVDINRMFLPFPEKAAVRGARVAEEILGF